MNNAIAMSTFTAGPATAISISTTGLSGMRSSRVQRNLSNQFEAPMFAYFAAAVLLAASAVQWWDVAAAWLFFAGRVVHTLVQTLTDNVALRGQVFVINFLGVAVLMGHVALLALSGSPR